MTCTEYTAVAGLLVFTGKLRRLGEADAEMVQVVGLALATVSLAFLMVKAGGLGAVCLGFAVPGVVPRCDGLCKQYKQHKQPAEQSECYLGYVLECVAVTVY